MPDLKKIYCLTPIYNDWESFAILLENLDKIQSKFSKEFDFSVIAVNDGSTEMLLNDYSTFPFEVNILNLKINIGHQRAIAVGLQYIYNEIENFDYVVVMDSDGEDKPENIVELLNKIKQEHNGKIIFAQRKKKARINFI